MKTTIVLALVFAFGLVVGLLVESVYYGQSEACMTLDMASKQDTADKKESEKEAIKTCHEALEAMRDLHTVLGHGRDRDRTPATRKELREVLSRNSKYLTSDVNSNDEWVLRQQACAAYVNARAIHAAACDHRRAK